MITQAPEDLQVSRPQPARIEPEKEEKKLEAVQTSSLVVADSATQSTPLTNSSIDTIATKKVAEVTADTSLQKSPQAESLQGDVERPKEISSQATMVTGPQGTRQTPESHTGRVKRIVEAVALIIMILLIAAAMWVTSIVLNGGKPLEIFG